MCRISGIINPSLPLPRLQEMVKEMCTIMRHGGPDDEGIYCNEENGLVLGHRRLSLIDLSACGHQPMSYDNGRYEISFNGEIYNYREIKEALLKIGFPFATASDTEVILAAFAAWGTGSFEKFNGMFAFALWDNEQSKLYLVRDSSGIKPLYYAATKEGLAFASEIRGFGPIPYLQEENEFWPVYLMAYGHLPEPVTILKNVQPLKKGCFLCYDIKSQHVGIEAFHQFPISPRIFERGEAIELVRESLQQSVHRHLIADAPIGVFLSGGLDSGIIALLAHADRQTRLNTLSLYFEDDHFSEKRYQDLLLKKMNCESSQHLLKEDEFHQYLPGIIGAMDQPSCDGINTWFISKHARENGLKAVLSGIGGDELYGGYPSFERMHKVNLLEKIPRQLLRTGKYTSLKRLRRMGYLSLDGAAGKYLFLRGQFVPHEIAAQLNMSEEQVWKILAGQPQCEPIENLSAFNQASWVETHLFMQNQLLRDVDVMSMAHGIEIRVPFLDKQFVADTLAIDARVKSEGPLPKQLLIDTFKDMLPEPVWNRPKMGFGLPFKHWLANDDFIKSLVDPADEGFKKFSSGQMHWSQFLSLALIKNRQSARSGTTHPLPSKKMENDEIAFHNHNTVTGKTAPLKIMLLTLRAFSITGGIEKVSKVAGKALYELCNENGGELDVCSMYDEQADVDTRYLPRANFKGFGIRRMSFTYRCFFMGIKKDVVILSHINLLPVGYFIKRFSPKTKLVLIAHGIEVWKPLSGAKQRMLLACEQILAVSKFTREMIMQLNRFPPERILVLNNCLDPFLEKPVQKEKDPILLQKYHLEKGDTVMMTLTRLAARERYKGYDIVIKSLQELRKANPRLKYLVLGKYDEDEKDRLDRLVGEAGLKEHVIFTGFVPDEELAEHFNLSDIYIMPSEKEGFGIAFIEAMYHNKPVIAGNSDGSADALLDGRLGMLVNPKSIEEVSGAISEMMESPYQFLPDRELLMQHFSFPVYKGKWKNVLKGLNETANVS